MILLEPAPVAICVDENRRDVTALVAAVSPGLGLIVEKAVFVRSSRQAFSLADNFLIRLPQKWAADMLDAVRR